MTEAVTPEQEERTSFELTRRQALALLPGVDSEAARETDVFDRLAAFRRLRVALGLAPKSHLQPGDVP